MEQIICRCVWTLAENLMAKVEALPKEKFEGVGAEAVIVIEGKKYLIAVEPLD